MNINYNQNVYGKKKNRNLKKEHFFNYFRFFAVHKLIEYNLLKTFLRYFNSIENRMNILLVQKNLIVI